MEGQITKEGLARVLKQLRVNNNLTQQELADMLYCDIRQIGFSTVVYTNNEP